MKTFFNIKTNSLGITFTDWDGDNYKYPHTFDALEDALECAEEALDEELQFKCATIFDCVTNEVYATCEAEHCGDEDDCDWGYNEDMGYDPYLGCYTDDC